MGNGAGDKLASGAHKAAFPPSGGNVSQKKWDNIFGENTGPKQNILKSKKTRRK